MGTYSGFLWALVAVLGAITTLRGVEGTSYSLAKDYSGPSFFDEWDFYDKYDDTNNGDVNFVSAANGTQHHLAYVDSTTNRAIMRVDNTTFVPYNIKRDSVRITTKARYEIGSVWVVDVWHAPYGCSVWPAMWTFAPGSAWPAGGEIDIFEGINLLPSSQMGLHTTAGCTQASPVQASKIINGTNCEGVAGCIVTNDHPAGYGEAFAKAGGGVFVTELAASGVSIWFFSRPDVPEALKNNARTIDTSALGTPMGNWPAGGCDIERFFLPQALTFDITLCGDFAGSPQFFPQTCPGTCYLDYVINNGTSQYANAYFDVGYVRVFSAGSNSTNAGSSTSNNSSSSTSTDSSSSSSSSGSSSGSSRTIRVDRLAVVGVAVGLMYSVL